MARGDLVVEAGGLRWEPSDSTNSSVRAVYLDLTIHGMPESGGYRIVDDDGRVLLSDVDSRNDDTERVELLWVRSTTRRLHIEVFKRLESCVFTFLRVIPASPPESLH